MGEPSRPRVKVSGQISFTSSPSSSSIPPRVRAKVDPSTISTPPNVTTRPAIRSTPSSVSLRSGVSATSAGRARSPAPQLLATSTQTPIYTPPLSPPLTNDVSNQAVRVRGGPMYKSAKSPETPIYRSLTEVIGQSGPGPSSSAKAQPSSRGVTSVEGRIRPRAQPLTPTPTTRLLNRSYSRTPLISNSQPPNDQRAENHPYQSAPTISPDRPLLDAPRPVLNKSGAFPSLIHLQHPTASCPPSPLPASDLIIETHRSRILPAHPLYSKPPGLPPPTPGSPEIKTISLPELTPRTSGEYEYRYESEVSDLGKHDDDRDRLSGVTAVEVDLGKEGGVDEVIDDGNGDVEEAKVNRKIADLEISNASLLAINHSLEATKSKQRAEILRLRRALRDSLSGISQPFIPLTSPPIMSPSLMSPTPDDDTLFEEEFVDSELEVRWERVSELVGGMVRRGELAVEKGKEEVRLGTRVLGVEDITRESTPGPNDGEEDNSFASMPKDVGGEEEP
ncbi:hypothetical protein BCR39DRAFT_516567 [Naematelia encephala]|uniref:Uncharacterized protein n=1 Tax=Naematelia encephala TaxID=71784 RepID=A0A1Y2BKC0_9TREE|nr:hypothetical protein BCR39DRAFT_516567 [Naematelia encephala]